MSTAAATVDLAAIKSRHSLGGVVEAAGVRLTGRGRVRQGVCPFHEEIEGSFTVYGDTERWYCFGCGAGGDVLDFVRRAEGLSLPEAVRHLDGHAPVAPAAPHRHPAPDSRDDAVVPLRDPALLATAVRFYAGRLHRSPEAQGYLASRGIGPETAARLHLGYAPGTGLRAALGAAGFTWEHLRDSGLLTDRGERFAGMVVVPDIAGGRVRWLAGRAVDPERSPRFQALPGPKSVLGLGRLGPRAAVGGAHRGRLRLARAGPMGPPCLRRPGHPRPGEGRRRPAGLPPRPPRLRHRRRGPCGIGPPRRAPRTPGRRRDAARGRRGRG